MTNLILTQIPLEDFKTAISEAVRIEVEKLGILKKDEPDTEYITRKQTSTMLGVSLPTLNDWSKRGIIKSYRIASRVRYKKAEVLTALSQVQTIKHRRA